MSVHDQVKEDDLQQSKDSKKSIRETKTKLLELRSFLALQDDANFQQWFSLYIRKPNMDAFTASLTELETNKSFSYKGKLQVYNRQSKWVDDVRQQIDSLQKNIETMEKDLHGDEESLKPEN